MAQAGLPAAQSLIPHGVSLLPFRKAQPAGVRARHGIAADAPLLIFHGTLHYWPNTEAVRFIAEQLLPRLVGPLPGVRVLICGMSPPRYYAHPAIVFTGPVDDLPAHGLESLRVRFDLLGPGNVEIDGVRVFDLAFDESQRVQLSRRLSVMEQRLAAGDLGSCLIELDTYWPRFLAAFVSDEAVAALREDSLREDSLRVPGGPAQPPVSPTERSGSMFDRVRRWWQ
jgi:hypothetical protein